VAIDVRRRLFRDLAAVLILTGSLLALDVVVTLAWREPVTAVIGSIERGQIDERFLAVNLNSLDRHALATLTSTAQRVAFLARSEQQQVQQGAAIGRIVIPTLGVDFEIVQGTDNASLEKGPGHYPGTAFPGLGQTVGIAGHRTTYLAPFRHIDRLAAGDQIVIEMPYARLRYVVEYRRIVAPSEIAVVDDVGYDRLVLSACNPLYSAAQRLVVFARLADVQPRGAALGPLGPHHYKPLSLPGQLQVA
jgi:sortase A